MRWIAVAALVLVVGACAPKIISATPTGISMERHELTTKTKKIAKEHCAKYGKKAQLVTVEPMSFVSQIYYFDCV